MAKYHSTKPEDRTNLGSRALEGLKNDAYLVAEDFGLKALAEADAIPQRNDPQGVGGSNIILYIYIYMCIYI